MRIMLAALCAWAIGAGAMAHDVDGALAAIERAQLRECPAAHAAPDAHTAGDPQTIGLEGETIALIPLASDPARALRLRRLTLAPGGAIAWHDHASVQGVALVVAGEVVETRNSCRERMVYRPGDAAREDEATAHSWRNESDAPAVLLVAQVVTR